jgi:hypothetical protein
LAGLNISDRKPKEHFPSTTLDGCDLLYSMYYEDTHLYPTTQSEYLQDHRMPSLQIPDKINIDVIFHFILERKIYIIIVMSVRPDGNTIPKVAVCDNI